MTQDWVRNIVATALIIFVLVQIGIDVYRVRIDPGSQGIANSYCRANGYEGATKYKFTPTTFFVNCTSQENCASDQECMRKNGMVKE